MDQPWLLVVFLFLGVGLVWAVLLSTRRRKCAKCGKARVSGRKACPFCGTPYFDTTEAQHRSGISGRSPAPKYELRFVSGPRDGYVQPVETSHLSIGRSQASDLVLDGMLISREHAQIVYENGRFVLYDKDSTNGTYLNGRRVASNVLVSGDQIQIGPHILEFRIEGEGIPSPPPRPQPRESPPPVYRVGEIGDYVLTPLHTGGFATVHKGVARNDPKNVVAVKILHQTDPYARDKFKQEGYLGKSLWHPNIVHVLKAGAVNGSLYIMMEFVDGGTLRERLTRERRLSLRDAVEVATQVCAALQYAHGEGVVHRDIKPENIMFTSQGQVKVVDFGIARWRSQQTVTSIGVILGTPWYLSPEQAKGSPVDQRTDIYSLGVVLYEMLTGRVPFDGDAIAVMHQHVTKPPPPPAGLNPQIPAEVQNVLLKALEKDRTRRYGSARDMATALQRAAHVRVAQSVSVPPPRPRPSRRYPSRPVRAPAARLLIQSGASIGRVIPLKSPQVVLTRQIVAPEDNYISRKGHAKIMLRGDQYWIEDLQSTNGTSVNGVRVFRAVPLSPGSEIRIGRQVLRFEM